MEHSCLCSIQSARMLHRSLKRKKNVVNALRDSLLTVSKTAQILRCNKNDDNNNIIFIFIQVLAYLYQLGQVSYPRQTLTLLLVPAVGRVVGD